MQNLLTERYLLGIGIVLLASLCLNSCKQNESTIEKIESRSKSEVLVCAHRSFHKNAPENSMQSILDAIDAKVDIVEIDVRTTIDDSLVLMHDKTIDRTTTGKGKLKDFTYQELQAFQLKMGDSVTTHKIPTLYQVMIKLKDKPNTIANLDLKGVQPEHLIKKLKEWGVVHQVISYTGSQKKTMAILKEDSLYAAMPLIKKDEDILFYKEHMSSPFIHFTDSTFTEKNVRLAVKNRQLGFVNILWNQDKDLVKGDFSSVDKVIALRPAIIQTDHPKLLVDYLRSKGLHR
ncbi:glycerophosphodiester phosphodiesterase family protein [Marinifilum caeruleilacunae]|uniref:Glycerophosphodiester phosphodiesterase family protein n=1 Tax=Marinifilum caeruleilacunae TaxID=2499076 RepID=A0ABX1WRT8_9BACT|nr:glycerophosphodiester phosphodiesterase family protein [Marinifilum caeruleilacunae]NOU58717.1 glycerophosphodiester phosphodiesterase family protein [Marinifilum caeruleilacunae]